MLTHKNVHLKSCIAFGKLIFTRVCINFIQTRDEINHQLLASRLLTKTSLGKSGISFHRFIAEIRSVIITMDPFRIDK
jgi:hypothetical protein